MTFRKGSHSTGHSEPPQSGCHMCYATIEKCRSQTPNVHDLSVQPTWCTMLWKLPSAKQRLVSQINQHLYVNPRRITAYLHVGKLGIKIVIVVICGKMSSCGLQWVIRCFEQQNRSRRGNFYKRPP